jgi:hypothetical protein
MNRKIAGLTGLLLMLAASTAAQAIPALDGDWEGALTASGGIKLRLGLHIESHDGAASAALTSLDQGNGRILVAVITREGDVVTLNLPMVHGGFKGTLSSDGNTISGTWTQGVPLPLTFARRAASFDAPQQ